MSWVQRRKTVKISLMDERSLEEYDTILNTPGITIVRELQVDEKVTEHGNDDQPGSTTITPYIVVTYMERELI